MSDVTPSIFDIKWRYEAYREQEHQRGRTGVTPVSPGEFDRWYAAEIRKAKAEALREAADALDHCTEADVNNAIGRPSPTYRHSQRYADVYWLHARADQIEEDQ